ncbi:hypothetical protein BpHYR1_024983 [Brachionus plicatilis]|uniref:Uncharacterized protein n=1 Tax=Brachionus plicatilis TaxID=10195 RepID=A0A3M7RUZ5_BRAPC|nr:hypothetical protein BpHYR1_024983 [Brachionus plicatilis]
MGIFTIKKILNKARLGKRCPAVKKIKRYCAYRNNYQQTNGLNSKQKSLTNMASGNMKSTDDGLNNSQNTEAVLCNLKNQVTIIKIIRNLNADLLDQEFKGKIFKLIDLENNQCDFCSIKLEENIN